MSIEHDAISARRIGSGHKTITVVPTNLSVGTSQAVCYGHRDNAAIMQYCNVLCETFVARIDGFENLIFIAKSMVPIIEQLSDKNSKLLCAMPVTNNSLARKECEQSRKISKANPKDRDQESFTLFLRPRFLPSQY